ncbi:peroxisome membrane anchor protein Pex14p, partial [Dichotomocladium elegans]
LREDLLKSAVSFLSSPNVRSAETAKKVAFLRQKGLTQAEIEEAFKRVGESGVNAAAQTPTSTSAPTAGPVAPRPAVPPRPTTAYTQVVYYPLPPAPPMPFQRIVGLALLVGVSTVGLTAAVLNIIK